MRKPIELRQADLLAGGAGAPVEPGISSPPAGDPGAQSGADFMGSLDSMMERANNLIMNVKDLVGMMRGSGALGAPGAQGKAAAIYQPQPTMEQQIHRVVNMCYTSYGDISIQDLLQGLMAQYGKTKLSQILKALEGR